MCCGAACISHQTAQIVECLDLADGCCALPGPNACEPPPEIVGAGSAPCVCEGAAAATAPVCGAGGITFENECEAGCAGIEVIAAGRCNAITAEELCDCAQVRCHSIWLQMRGVADQQVPECPQI